MLMDLGENIKNLSIMFSLRLNNNECVHSSSNHEIYFTIWKIPLGEGKTLHENFPNANELDSNL